MTRAGLLLLAVFVGGCFHTKSLGFERGDEALVEREVLGRATRYLIDVDRGAALSTVRVRLLAVEGITERMRAAHERLERVETTQTWPPPFGWFIRDEVTRETAAADGLLYQPWSKPHERFDVTPVPGQQFEVTLDAAPPRRIAVAASGWAEFSLGGRPAQRAVIRTVTPNGPQTRTVDLR